MPNYSITAPDGKTYSVSGPVGATQADVAAQVLRHYPEAAVEKSKKTGIDLSKLSTADLKAVAAGNMAGVSDAGLQILAGSDNQPKQANPVIGTTVAEVQRQHPEAGIPKKKTIEAELADGRILEFPEGTDPSVIQATVKRMLASEKGVVSVLPTSPAIGTTVAVTQAETTPTQLKDTVLSSGVTAAVVGLMVGCLLWFVASWRWRKSEFTLHYPGQAKLESAKNFFFVTLGVDIVATSLVVASYVWAVGLSKDISSGVITADQSLLSKLEFLDSLSWVLLITLIGVGFGLMKWLIACYRYAKEVVGATGFKQEGWIGASWIIPIFNLFKPYQIINEIYKAGAPNYAMPDGWKKESGSGLLLTWWIVWAVTHFFWLIISKELSKISMRDDISLQKTTGLIEFQAWMLVTSVIIGLLWFVVAGSLTQRLISRSTHEAKRFSDAQANTPSPPSSPAAASGGIVRPVTADEDEELHRQAFSELNSADRKPGLWAMALAKTANGGNPDGVYITLRVEQLKSDIQARDAAMRGSAS